VKFNVAKVRLNFLRLRHLGDCLLARVPECAKYTQESAKPLFIGSIPIAASNIKSTTYVSDAKFKIGACVRASIKRNAEICITAQLCQRILNFPPS